MSDQKFHIHFRLFPPQTKLVGPVVILQQSKTTAITFTSRTVVLSLKLILPDRTEIVIGMPMRSVWSGADGTAFDQAPDRFWKIAAVSSRGVITQAPMPFN
jgi:hypothetical protein